MVTDGDSSSCGPRPAGPRASLHSPPASTCHSAIGSPLSPWVLRHTGEHDRSGRIVGDTCRLEELDLRVHAVALADAVEPGPGVERLGCGPCLPQVDAAGP